MPRVNATLLVGVLLLVLMFRTSSALAHAYVLAVSATSFLTTMLLFVVLAKLWRWPIWATLAVILPLLLVDGLFFVAATMKLAEGAYVPVLFGAIVVLLILTWRRGTRLLYDKTRRTEVPLDTL